MNRAAIRQQLTDRLHRSRLGWVGWLVDGAEWLGCRFAGHRPFDDYPHFCRHCGVAVRTGRASVSSAASCWCRPSMIWAVLGVLVLSAGAGVRSVALVSLGVALASATALVRVRAWRRHGGGQS